MRGGGCKLGQPASNRGIPFHKQSKLGSWNLPVPVITGAYPSTNKGIHLRTHWQATLRSWNTCQTCDEPLGVGEGPVDPHMCTLTCAPSHVHPHMCTLTCAPSLSHCTLTCAPSHVHPHMCTLTCAPSQVNPHIAPSHVHPHTCTLTCAPSHVHPHMCTLASELALTLHPHM